MKHLLFFLCILFTSSSIHAQYQLRSEIFDFQEGDEFHYSWTPGQDYSWGVKRRFILQREDFPSQDSVRYKIRRENYRSVATMGDPPFVEYYNVDTVNFGYGNLSSEITPWICNDTLPPGACYAQDTLLENSFCGKDVAEFRLIAGVPYFEYERYLAKYARGLGRFVNEYISDSGVNYLELTEMIYYKKGDDECGTPDYSLVSIPITSYDPEISINPNPSSGIFYLDITHKKTESLNIFDTNGSQVYHTSSPTSFLDLSMLNPGIYYVIIKGENFHSSKRIVKL